MNYLFVLDCAVLFAVPLWFVAHKVYLDGVFGRAGLLGVSFGAATFLFGFADGIEYDVLPQMLILVTSFAVFLVWHLLRFERRIAKQKEAQ